MTAEFKTFTKIGRLRRDVVITEKIDGTNGVVWISESLTEIRAGSRNRWLTSVKGDDNHGFGMWVEKHAGVLIGLGPGYHYGEWWGCGIARGYDLTEKRWSLFNPRHYQFAVFAREQGAAVYTTPILYTGPFADQRVTEQLEELRANGSVASPGYMHPEGVVVFHTANGALFKVTLEHDEKPKGSTEPVREMA